MPSSDYGYRAPVKPEGGDSLNSDSVKTITSLSLQADQAAQLKPAPEECLIGKTLDKRFRILSRLGKGGMSEVFKAEHLILQQMVALKVLLSRQESKANSVDRFQQEAKAISALDHPNVVKVYAFGLSDNQRLYLAMDFLDGKSLSEILEIEGPLPWKRVLNWCIQIAEGLEHAHSRGVIHRDLKPSNIVIQVDQQGNEIPKIVDFGIARLTTESGKELKQLTMEGSTCGSPPYMSPEQCMGETVDARSDIYSFGCMMYELLSGQRPFRANSNMEVMQMQVEQVPKMFRTVCPDQQVPESLEAVLRTCMAKKAEQRYQSMSELLNDLKSIGTESLAEKNLKEGLKTELQKELAASGKAVWKKVQFWLLPVAGTLLLGCAGVSIYSALTETKIVKLKKQFQAIKPGDVNRYPKLIATGMQIVDLDIKAGNRNEALLTLQDLDKQLHEMTPCLSRSQYLARIAKHYIALGRPEGEVLLNQVIAELEAYILRCDQARNTAAMEPAALLVIKLCRDIPEKRDHALGQYSRLIPGHIFNFRFQRAERLCNEALDLIKSNSRTGDICEMLMLDFLSTAQIKQGKIAAAEATLLHSWDVCEKGWSTDSPVSQKLLKTIVDFYRAQGKEAEAEKFSALLTPDLLQAKTH